MFTPAFANPPADCSFARTETGGTFVVRLPAGTYRPVFAGEVRLGHAAVQGTDDASVTVDVANAGQEVLSQFKKALLLDQSSSDRSFGYVTLAEAQDVSVTATVYAGCGSAGLVDGGVGFERVQ